MFDIGEAFGYPLEGDDVASNLLIGSLLLIAVGVIALVGSFLLLFFIGILILPFAIVPGLFLYGYLVKIIESTLRGESTPPTFDDWKELGMDGGRALVVVIVYQLPAYVIFIGGLFLTVGLGAIAGSAAGSGDPSQLVGTIFGGGSLIIALLALLYLLVASYLLPAAICTMAADGSINGAFDFGNIKKGAFTADYAVGWLLAWGVTGVIGQIGQLLAIILVGFPIIIYSYMVSARLIGSGFREGLANNA
jgi:hypothetical protein